MKTKLLPLAAILSVVSFGAHADIHGESKGAYVTDSYGNIVRDSWDRCTRTTAWTKETAIASCESKDEAAPAAAASTEAAPVAAPAATVSQDIKDNGKGAYVLDSDGDLTRDSWGYCVRSINWTQENEIARCEGKEEPVVAAPVAKPVPVVVPVAKPAPVAKPVPAPVPTIAQFQGFFDTNSAVLKDSAHYELNAYSDFMAAHPETKINITGHTDSRGAAAYNQQLSEKRAQAAKDYLANKGISEDRMAASGAGESNPIADNATAEGRAQNRRVEVELVK